MWVEGGVGCWVVWQCTCHKKISIKYLNCLSDTEGVFPIFSLIAMQHCTSIAACLVSFPDTSLQDNTPAGIIYAEDIQDISSDYEEAQKDISKVIHVLCVTGVLCDGGVLRDCGDFIHSMDSHLGLSPAEELSFSMLLQLPRE